MPLGIFLGIIGGAVALAIVADLLLERKGEQNSMSWAVSFWSRQAPILAVAIGLATGILFGHLWWPNHESCTEFCKVCEPK